MKKILFFLSNLNLVLIVIGFRFISILFDDDIADQTDSPLTILFRLFSFGVMMSIVFLRFQRIKYIPKIIWLFIFFWIIYIFKVAIYSYIPNSTVSIISPSERMIYIFGIILPSIITLSITSEIVNYRLCGFWIFALLAFSLSYSLFNSKISISAEIIQRITGSLSTSSLQYGQMGVSLSLISFYLSRNEKRFKLLYYIGFLLGVFIIIKSASRSPILSLILPIFIYIFLENKKTSKALIISLIFVLILTIFWRQILELVGYFSQTSAMRIMRSIQEGDSSGRGPLFKQAFNQFMENPILGGDYVLTKTEYKGLYPHNSVLEAFMATGIIGGAIYLYIITKGFAASMKDRYLIKNGVWVSLIFYQYFIFGLFSNSIYKNTIVASLIVLILVNKRKTNNLDTTIK